MSDAYNEAPVVESFTVAPIVADSLAGLKRVGGYFCLNLALTQLSTDGEQERVLVGRIHLTPDALPSILILANEALNAPPARSTATPLRAVN